MGRFMQARRQTHAALTRPPQRISRCPGSEVGRQDLGAGAGQRGREERHGAADVAKDV